MKKWIAICMIFVVMLSCNACSDIYELREYTDPDQYQDVWKLSERCRRDRHRDGRVAGNRGYPDGGTLHQTADRQRISRALSHAETQESILQRLCLALVFVLWIRGAGRRLVDYGRNIWRGVYFPAQRSVGHRV